MPYKITKLVNNKFQVKNVKTGDILAKGTTKIKAEKQIKLLNFLEGNKKIK
jgi:hypothetical protein